MNELPPNPILEFNPDQIGQVRKIFNYDDINRLHQDLNILQDWIKMQQHFVVKEFDRDYLERFLINSKGSIERAKKIFDKMCTVRGLMPEYLQGLHVENEFDNFMKVFYTCALPKPTTENYRILFYGIHNPDPKLFEHIDLARYLFVVIYYLQRHDYNAGIILVCDVRNFNFGIIAKLDPMVLTNFVMILVEAIGLRLRGFHLMTESKLTDIVVGMVKQALSKKLSSRLHIHESNESLHKFIAKELLPKDVDGELDTAFEMTEKSHKEFYSPAFIEHLKYIETAVTDESKRLCSEFTEQYSGMPGSFKVLSVD